MREMRNREQTRHTDLSSSALKEENCQEKVKVEKSKGMLSNFLGLNLGSSNTKEK